MYLQEYHSYDELLEKLDLFQSYRNRATELVDDWNFELGKYSEHHHFKFNFNNESILIVIVLIRLK